MNAKREIVVLLATFAAFAAACSSSKTYVKKGQVTQTLEQDPSGGKVLEAIGIGAADPTLSSDTQKKALARDAAIVKAQFEMLSMVKGVQIEGGVTVARAIEQDSTLESKLKEVIKGAEIIKTEYTTDNGAVVTIRLPKKRLEDMMGVKFK